MGATNHGTQEITYEYFEEATAEDFNKRHLDIRPRGIYKGGYLTRVNDSEITLSLFTAEIGDDDEQISVKTSTTATLKAATLDSGSISSSTPYIVLRWAFVEAAGNYVEVHAIASVAAALANDIIVGKCNFSGAVLVDFDYTDRTFLNVQDLLFKVETSSGLYVQLRAGRVQDGSQCIIVPEQKVGAFTLPGSPNSRIDLVYIDTDGTVTIVQGTQAVSPVAPDYENRLVVAEVKIVNGDTIIPADRITDVRSFLVPTPESGLGSWANKSNNVVYQAATDGFVLAYKTGEQGALSGYTDSSNPPTTLRQKSHTVYSNRYANFCMPVAKNDYWKVTGADAVMWIPFGS